MFLLTFFAFLAGIVTILSPCILPILPIILSSTLGKARPFGIVIGFVGSFTFFTLFLSTIVKQFGISADALRMVSVFVIAGFGISLLIPQVQTLIEMVFARLSKFVPRNNPNPGLWSGMLIGLSLGLLWTPCVGPILASVISLAIAGTVTLDAFILTLAYSLGTAIPMLIIMIGGQKFIPRSSWTQKIFGVIMLATALIIFMGWDKSFQAWMLEQFPNYGMILTRF